VVIGIRSASELSEPGSGGRANAARPAQAQSGTDLDRQGHRKDYIKKNFGNLEEAFINSIGGPSSPPKRSRDESIKLIYDIASPGDWLDLIEGYDDHVFSPLLYF
jgi:hypothetical protein